MPSTMIHLYTGVQFIKSSNKVNNKSQFYLGCIAPDAVNTDSFASKDVRWSAHIRHSSIESWIQNTIDFYTDNLSKPDTGGLDIDFLLGYTLHIFSDLAWDKRYDSDMRARIDTSNMTQEQKKSARWDEFYYYDKTLFKQSWWLNDVKPLLEQSLAKTINEIPSELINQFKEYCLNDYEASIADVAPTIITPELIEDFSYFAIAMLKNEL